MQVPLLDLRAQYSPLKAEILETVAELCDSQRFILGPKVEAFEQELAAYCQSGGAVGVTSGSDALIIALMVEGVKPGCMRRVIHYINNTYGSITDYVVRELGVSQNNIALLQQRYLERR